MSYRRWDVIRMRPAELSCCHGQGRGPLLDLLYAQLRRYSNPGCTGVAHGSSGPVLDGSGRGFKSVRGSRAIAADAFAPHGRLGHVCPGQHVLSSGVSHVAAQDPGGVRYLLLTDRAVS